jgi:hypothetical protein
MKTLTLSQKQILFGVLVVSLGFTKSWMQTAEANSGLRDLASGSDTIEETRKVKIDDTTRDVVAKIENREAGKKKDLVNGKIVETNDPATKIVVSFNDNGCTSCIAPIELANLNSLAEAWDLIDKHIAEQVTTNARKEKEAKENEEAIANCDKVMKDGKLVELEDYSKERFECKAKKTKSISDREERRTAFQTDVVDELQEALLESNSAAERKELLAAYKAVKRTMGSDRALRTDMDFLKKGVEAMTQIPSLAQDTVLNPRHKLQNELNIDRHAFNFNFDTNARLGRYSEETQSMIRDWQSVVVPVASQAVNSPNEVVREFYESLDIPGLPGGDIDFNGDQRARRQDLNNLGIRELPQYQMNRNGNRGNNYRNNMNRGGNQRGNYRGNQRGNYRGNNMMPYDDYYADDYYDPRDPRMMNGGSNYRPMNGPGYMRGGPQYNMNNYRGYQRPGYQSRNRYAPGPGYQRGGIPQSRYY